MSSKRYAVLTIHSFEYSAERYTEATVFETFDDASGYLKGLWNAAVEEERAEGTWIDEERSFCTDTWGRIQWPGAEEYIEFILSGIAEKGNLKER